MHIAKQLLATLFVVFSLYTASSQELNSTVKDSLTLEPIPYVNIVLANKKGVITNEEGRFSLSLDNATEKDSIFISCIGYETIKKLFTEFTDSIIYLKPKTTELSEVLVSNKNYTVEEIIDFVKDSLDSNYNYDFTKKKIFFRESYHQNLDKTNYTFMKSTIKELNKEFLDSIRNTVPKKDESYSEILCDLYGNYKEESFKINLLKACHLYDKNNEINITKLEEKFNAILKNNVKPNSYFKIKSGIFGTKVSAKEMGVADVKKDSIALKKKLDERKKREASRKKNFSGWKKNSLARQLKLLFFMDDANVNVINKSNRYVFTLENYTYLGDEPVYILSFKPKRKEDYKGTLYINAEDFAVIRLDYENVRNISSIKLLGISHKEHIERGKMIFSKGNNNKYDLKFFERVSGSKSGIKRPLKIIEKNKFVKGRNKQNELYLKIDLGITNINKYEIVVFNTEDLTETKFNSYKENNTVTAVNLRAYDPNFWKGYNIIEPNQAIKEFTAKGERP